MILRLSVLFVLSCKLLHAQQHYLLTEKHADCSNAVEITDTLFGPTSAPVNSGKLLEVSGNSKNDPLYFEREHHTVWYTFRAFSSGELGFDIVPKNANDDYDFLLFKHTGNGFCDAVREKKIRPLRSNISRNNKALKSITGLAAGAKQDFVPSGPGPAHSKTIPVLKGEMYCLVLDNVYEKGEGHSIRFHYTPEKIKLEAGQRIRFSNIQFESNKDVILPVSHSDLDSLLAIMRNNPDLKIEIQGHVNGPGQINDFELQDLSEKRAKAVHHFLLENGIAAERIRWSGFGNTQMLFPEPVTEAEAQMNRRVEILIL